MSFLNQFFNWTQDCILESDEARDYLNGRGVSESQWRRHGIGYVPGDYFADPSLDAGHGEQCQDRERKSLHCDSCRFTRWSTVWSESEEGGSKTPSPPGRRIVGSIVFPMTNYSGQAAGFQVRSLKEKVYDTFLVTRRPEGYFFGTAANIDLIWSRKEVFLVESAFDGLTWERLVAPNVLALTTNVVSPVHMRFLRRFVNRVVLCLNMDGAGRDGVHRFVKDSQSSFDVRDVKYPRVREEDSDLNDFWKRVGDERFSEYFNKRVMPTL